MLQKLIIFSIFLFTVPAIFACSCFPGMTVNTAFDEAGAVYISRIESVVEARPEEKLYNNVKGVYAIVEKVYKGGVRRGDRIFYRNGNDCGNMQFGRQYIGRRYLHFVNIRPRNLRFTEIVASYCGRNSELSAAAESLLYLDKLPRAHGKTRIAGSVTLKEGWTASDGDVERPLPGIKVIIRGRNKTYKLTTDIHGVYEAYGVPPGKYKVEIKSAKYIVDSSLTLSDHAAWDRMTEKERAFYEKFENDSDSDNGNFNVYVPPAGQTGVDIVFHRPVLIRVPE
jgi:hypothetical protein